MSGEGESKKRDDAHVSRMGRFIQTYSSFLSSFVIGVAGLVATSIWQYRQSQTAIRQAESEQKIATTKAENEWRIARADILAKNLDVLSKPGKDTAERRYGVLLSLTRGGILEPELAVSYALELGKDEPGYMKDVLDATEHKSFPQLAHAFELTCAQHYGVGYDIAACATKSPPERSETLAELIKSDLDELDALGNNASANEGPRTLLRDEHEVVDQVAKLTWLFRPYLEDLYDRRLWKPLSNFESSASGAKLVAALVLLAQPVDALASDAERAENERLRAGHRKWLDDFLTSRSCDAECRAKILAVMLSLSGEVPGNYADTIKRLLLLPRSESGPAADKLRKRLLLCKVSSEAQASLRDQVLVPSLTDALARPQPDTEQIEHLLVLLAAIPEPSAETASPAWTALGTALQKAGSKYEHALAKQRAEVKKERAKNNKASFCKAAESRADANAGD
jgi:hypothetical protein